MFDVHLFKMDFISNCRNACQNLWGGVLAYELPQLKSPVQTSIQIIIFLELAKKCMVCGTEKKVAACNSCPLISKLIPAVKPHIPVLIRGRIINEKGEQQILV
mmetsp:Transcript_12321/g.6134  ORF Transcript_12321/g.6134 Transcript_12321/m.6134 type:complete len:103 (-) Transcript_12321:212-520(-)